MDYKHKCPENAKDGRLECPRHIAGVCNGSQKHSIAEQLPHNKRYTEVRNQQHSFEILMQNFSLVPFSNTTQNTPRLDTSAAATSPSTMVDVQQCFENAAIET